ncbi:MAG: DUF7594 domain-containing protein [Gaiellaceae bacterium]
MAAFVAMFAAGVGVAAVPTKSASRQPRITAVRANADAHVTAATRAANYGHYRRLSIDGRPVVRTYVSFVVAGGPGKVRRVNLLLYSYTRSSLGYRVRLALGNWKERRITFANAPRFSSRFVASGPLRARTWKAVDVTSLVGAVEGVTSFALTTVGIQAIELASRESGLTGPRLVVERKQPRPVTEPPPPPTA